MFTTQFIKVFNTCINKKHMVQQYLKFMLCQITLSTTYKIKFR